MTITSSTSSASTPDSTSDRERYPEPDSVQQLSAATADSTSRDAAIRAINQPAAQEQTAAAQPPTQQTGNESPAGEQAGNELTGVNPALAPPHPTPPDIDLQHRKKSRPILKTIARALLIVLLFYFFYSGVRLALYGYAGYQNARALLDLYGQSANNDGQLRGGQFVVEAYPHIQELHRITIAVNGSIQFVAAPLRVARSLPYVGETAAAVPALLDAGRDLTEIGMGTATLLLQTGQVNPDASLIEVLGQTVEEQTEGFAMLSTRAEQMRAQLDQIDTSALLDFAVEPMLQMQATARLVEAGLHVSPALPGLLGLDSPRTYLLLMQNNHELRATGGFISAVGDVTIDRGKIGDINIEDSYRIMSHAADHPAAPEAVLRYMGIDLIFVRDANWSPDFPTTAALIRALYTQDMGTPVDGIIAIDLHAVQRLVGAVGPLVIEGAEEPVTGENFVDQVIHFWETPLETGDTLESAGLGDWWRQRKDFMPALAEAALGKLRSGRVNPLALAHSTVTSLDSGSIQIWLAEPVGAQTLDNFGWSGRIAAPMGEDYLAPVDSNMGYNKVDAVLSRRLQYQVEWEDNTDANPTTNRTEDGRAIATATLHYSHPTPAPGHVCDPEPRYGENYTEMTQRCYFNFVRLYVPRGSELLSIEGVEPDSVALQNQLGPNNTDVFGGYFIMEPGTLHQVHFVYVLPATITPDDYRLTIRRQAGTTPLPLQIRAGAHTLTNTLENTHLTWTPDP